MPEFALEALRWPLVAVADLVEEGGPFVFWIFLCGVVMWTLVIERYWYFSRILPQQARSGAGGLAGARRSPLLVRAADPHARRSRGSTPR